jgi:hypothetical protein
MPTRRPADGFVFTPPTPPTKEELLRIEKEELEEELRYEAACAEEAQKSWTGRHPILTTILMAPVAIPAMLFLGFVWSLPEWFDAAERMHKRITAMLARKKL